MWPIYLLEARWSSRQWKTNQSLFSNNKTLRMGSQRQKLLQVNLRTRTFACRMFLMICLGIPLSLSSLWQMILQQLYSGRSSSKTWSQKSKTLVPEKFIRTKILLTMKKATNSLFCVLFRNSFFPENKIGAKNFARSTFFSCGGKTSKGVKINVYV